MRLFPFLICALLLAACNSPTETGIKSNEAIDSKTVVSEIAANADAKTIFETCVACHGANAEGNESLHAPALANQDAWYLESQLHNFKNGIRGTGDDVIGAGMAAIAQILDTSAMASVAQYIQNLPKVAVKKTVEGNIQAGKSQYNMICGACHGPGAEGNEALNSPKLSGIDDWYLERQLLNFTNGLRGLHPDDKYGSQMQQMTKTLKDKQAIKDVVAFIQSVQNNEE